MAVDPNVWDFPDPSEYPDTDLVGFGADLEPGTLLAAYRQAMFPMPGDEPGEIRWYSPVERGVLPLDGLRVTRSLRRAYKTFEVTVDTAFVEVMHGCGDPARAHGWIDDDIVAAYTRLHELGWAHSVEVWRDGELAGGLYGVAIGGLFAGESMFHRVRDASKVALVALVELLGDDTDRLLDTQWSTEHLATLGVVEIARAEYVRRLRRALELPLPARFAAV